VNERIDLDNLIQGFIYKTNSADKSFKIGTYAFSPYPLYMATAVTTDFRKDKTIIFEWDSSYQNGIVTTGAILNPYIIDNKANVDCNTVVWDTSTTNVNDPYYQPKIGRITTNTTKYFSCKIPANTGSTRMAFFPAMFTMEAWFRMDPIDIRPNGYISQVFSVYDGAVYRLGFAVSNNFLRIYLDDTIEDIHYMFNETRSYWHYVAVSYTRHFERETIMQVWID